MIKNLTNRSINLESYQSNNKNINAVVNLNNINLHMAMICYILNVLYFKKKYNYKFSLFDYLNTRINLEYAWNIFQYFKYQELNDNTRKKLYIII